MEAKNIVGLAWWENGWRHLTTKKSIKKPDDLKGVKLRTMQNPVHIAAFKQIGAAPIPMAWGEVFTSLGQGVIDAQENPITVIASNSLWEVQKVVTLTGHVYGPHLVLISQKTLAKLPPDLQEVLKKLPAELASYQREQSAKLESEAIELLKSKGMAVNVVDKADFQKRVAPVVAQYEQRFGKDLIDRIRKAGD
jgi:tripartite ATP-independent transporter DctP family solute receptor